jgi:hypothetical protein
MDDHFFDAMQYYMSDARAHRGRWVVPMGEAQARAWRLAFPPERKGKMIRDVEIHSVVNGFIVTVGCQTVVFSDLDYMLQELKAYILNPEATEVRYRTESINAEALERGRGEMVGVPREQRVELVEEGMTAEPAPRDVPPVWEQIVERLDAADNARDRMAGHIDVQAGRDDQLSDRITELEAEVPRWRRVVTESGANTG